MKQGIIAFRPICCLHFGPVSKEKPRFGPFGGNEEDLRGTKNAKIAPNVGALFGGHYYYKIVLEMRFIAKMLAADRSNAEFSCFFWCFLFRTRSTTTRDRNLQFRGAVSTGGSPLDFLLFLQFFCAV